MERQPLVWLSDKSCIQKHAEVMELFYSGDKITKTQIEKQMNISRKNIEKILRKYYPKQGTRDVVILLQSKINDMWGEEDIDISALIEQESPVELI